MSLFDLNELNRCWESSPEGSYEGHRENEEQIPSSTGFEVSAVSSSDSNNTFDLSAVTEPTTENQRAVRDGWLSILRRIAAANASSWMFCMVGPLILALVALLGHGMFHSTIII